MEKEETNLVEDALALCWQVTERLRLAQSCGFRFLTRGLPQQESDDKAQMLARLEKKAEACRRCRIGQERTNLVFGRGNPNADLFFVGEAPGYYEDLQGKPFVGRAGQLLEKIINAMGLSAEDVYIGNILKCRPEGNRNPAPQEITFCTPFLEEQIKIIAPKVICALGAFAAKTLIATEKSIGSLRGRFHDYKGVPLMPTYHPAYLLRNPADKKKTWEDIKKVRDLLHL